MASPAVMAPTPQASTSFTRTPSKQSSDAQVYANMHAYGNPQSANYPSQTPQPQAPQQHSHPNQSSSQQNGAMPHTSMQRSFHEPSLPPHPRFQYDQPQIYTAVYSGVSVYEMEVNGVACMRRRADGWLNATQILKVAGVDKGKRTKVLEKEVLVGEHEKVQGGYGKYQGTWISYNRGILFCRQYGVEDILRPLLEYDLDGTNTGQTQDTPTKEQAMAANRKRYYNNGAPPANGTFFSNISPMSSVALAAMNKAARINSPGPKASSRSASTLNRRQSQQQRGIPDGSQQSIVSETSFNGDMSLDAPYASQHSASAWRADQEPPRKRMRASNDDSAMSHAHIPLDMSMQSITPTEANESFLFPSQAYADTFDSDEPVALPPLPAPITRDGEEKMALLLDLFADQARTDYSMHPALTQLSAEDYNIPLDASANTALHWAATLARVPLLELLLRKGANPWRGNAAGQSPLIAAVLVNNCWEHSCFPDLLELLGPLIEVRDAQGRTILHHIAVSSGIKGRSPSSKYYLEALLEFLVRSVAHPGSVSTLAVQPNIGNGDAGQDPARSARGPMSLMRFLSTIVNARDKAGNTALNLVARIGNRSIIQQLLEIKADPTLANYKGVSAREFGVGVDDSDFHANGLDYNQPPEHVVSSPRGRVEDGDTTITGSHAEDHNIDIVSSLTSMLTQNLSHHKTILAAKTAQIDRLNAQIQDLSAMQKQETDQFQNLQRRAKLREERVKKIENLRRVVGSGVHSTTLSAPPTSKLIGHADDLPIPYIPGLPDQPHATASLPPNPFAAATTTTTTTTSPPPHPVPDETRTFLTTLPAAPALRVRLQAYEANNTALAQRSAGLRSRSLELEALYRRVVGLCTGVPEARIEESLTGLVAAVESEKGGVLGREEVGRVREFLMKVEGVGNAEVV